MLNVLVRRWGRFRRVVCIDVQNTREHSSSRELVWTSAASTGQVTGFLDKMDRYLEGRGSTLLV